MPGSPPRSSTEPRTKPPPVTRSSSAMPVARRGASCDPPDKGSSAKRRPLAGLRPSGSSPPSSASVFHSPQTSHLPCQRLWAAPQFWQMKERVRRDMESLSENAGHAKGQTRTLQEHSLKKAQQANWRAEWPLRRPVNPVVAVAEPREDFVADGAGDIGDGIDRDRPADQGDEIAAAD